MVIMMIPAGETGSLHQDDFFSFFFFFAADTKIVHGLQICLCSIFTVAGSGGNETPSTGSDSLPTKLDFT